LSAAPRDTAGGPGSAGALAAWQAIDRGVLKTTRVVLFLLGLVFIIAVSIEVVSRLVMEVSLYFLHALTLFLLVWFFLLGAGLALREGAHVGFDLLVNAAPAPLRKAALAVGHLAVFAFFALMIWSGFATLPPALEQHDSSLGVSVFWVMLAFPVGFILLVYHQAASLVLERPVASAP